MSNSSTNQPDSPPRDNSVEAKNIERGGYSGRRVNGVIMRPASPSASHNPPDLAPALGDDPAQGSDSLSDATE